MSKLELEQGCQVDEGSRTAAGGAVNSRGLFVCGREMKNFAMGINLAAEGVFEEVFEDVNKTEDLPDLRFVKSRDAKHPREPPTK